jgi:predicted ferric reductase
VTVTINRPQRSIPPTSTPPVVVAPYGRRARFDAGTRWAAVAVLWASLLLVGYWWAADGGITDLGGWASGLTSIGRLTGLAASVLLMAQVVLMARIPVLEQAYGQDRLARVHRLVGFTSFSLMLAHIGLIIWGYAAGKLLATPATLWDLSVNYPGMLLAVAGTACLVLVAVTSMRFARRRLRYESWHLLHLYAYLGVGLALPHQLWTGQEFLLSTARTVFWWGWWIAAVGAVLVWRVGLPVVRTLRHRIRVDAVHDEAPGVISVVMTAHGAPVTAEAGQFFTFRFLGAPGWTRAHPYSLSAASDGRALRITVKTDGDGGAALRGLRPGSAVLIEGPLGRLTDRARTRRKLAFIAAGVGVTPVRALAEGLGYAPGEAVLLYRYSTVPLFDAELARLATGRGLQVVRLPGRRRSADSWLPDTLGALDDLTALRRWIPDLADRDVYVCGPDEWAEQVRRSATAAGLPAGQFHVESFGW